MCGIAAIFSYNLEAPPPDRKHLGAIHDAMAARGPDGEAIWMSDRNRIAMAHRRLSIIDLSDGGAQRIENRAG